MESLKRREVSRNNKHTPHAYSLRNYVVKSPAQQRGIPSIKSLSAMLRDSLVVPVTTVAIRKAALASRGR